MWEDGVNEEEEERENQRLVGEEELVSDYKMEWDLVGDMIQLQGVRTKVNTQQLAAFRKAVLTLDV